MGSSIAGLAVVVRDDHGNALANQPLSITASGGGSVTGAPTFTDAAATSVGTWKLGTTAGVNTLTITSGSLTPVTVSVRAAAGGVAQISSSVTAPAVSTVGTVYPLTLRVADSFGNAVAGATVQISVSSPSTIAASTATSDATGTITVPAWTLGTARGNYTITVGTGSASWALTVVAQAGPAAAVKMSNGNMTGAAGLAVSPGWSARVTDRFGNPVPRQAVAFVVSAGGGLLSGATLVTSDTNGLASGPTWVLGKRNVKQVLVASTASVSDSAAVSITTSFKIQLLYFGSLTDAQKSVIDSAVQRVTAAIINGGPPKTITEMYLNGQCLVPYGMPVSTTIDGILVLVGTKMIDGRDGQLSAGYPCYYRGATAASMPAIGVVALDDADINDVSRRSGFQDLVTHELLHALGFGYQWTAYGLALNPSGPDPRYVGTQGLTGCVQLGGASTCSQSVPVEANGGVTIAGLHWRESVFANELMTGYVDLDNPNPLSAMTIRAMADLGYAVNPFAADSLPKPAGLFQRVPRNH